MRNKKRSVTDNQSSRYSILTECFLESGDLNYLHWGSLATGHMMSLLHYIYKSQHNMVFLCPCTGIHVCTR